MTQELTSLLVLGQPTGWRATGLARAPVFLENGFCMSNSFVFGFRAPGSNGETLANDIAYLWERASRAVELASGTPFGLVFGGGGGDVYVNPPCGVDCDLAQIARRTSQLRIPDAVNIIDGDMIPVEFGPPC